MVLTKVNTISILNAEFSCFSNHSPSPLTLSFLDLKLPTFHNLTGSIFQLVDVDTATEVGEVNPGFAGNFLKIGYFLAEEVIDLETVSP